VLNRRFGFALCSLCSALYVQAMYRPITSLRYHVLQSSKLFYLCRL